MNNLTKTKLRPSKPLFHCVTELAAAGLSVIPVDHRTKKPIGSWGRYQQVVATPAELVQRFPSAVRAFAVVCGEVSGGVVCVDFDVPELFKAWSEKVGGIAKTLPTQRTGGGGYQVFYRCEQIGRNQKLARTKDGKTGIETRAEGGYAIVPPSIHPTGNQYKMVHGDLADIPLLDQKTVDVLLTAARSLDAAGDRGDLAPAGNTNSSAATGNVEAFLRTFDSLPDAVSGADGHGRTLFVGCEAFRWGLTLAQARSAIALYNQRKAMPPWSAKELDHKLADALSKVSAAGEFGMYTQKNSAQTWTTKIDDAAFYGLAGDICRVLEPHTESDPVAILLQLLVAFGNAIGRRAYFEVEQTRHYLNMFLNLIGRTSNGRKGTGWNRTVSIFQLVALNWVLERIKSGLSSGEGLIEAVRDDIEIPSKKPGGEPTVLPGVNDKRLMIVETEFASVLAMFDRDGNKLSPLLRQAWDGATLQTLTKNSPGTATGAHISIVGHITAEELKRHLDRTEMANGLANRFLWAYVSRSKCLPHGGNLNPKDMEPLIARLKNAQSKAQFMKRLQRSDDANLLWEQIYPKLSEGKPGLVGAMISRAEAQVLRLSCIYAVLDCSAIIGVDHLKAALAVWNYCESSVRHVFGDSLGDPIADSIYRRLQQHPAGLTRSELRDGFNRHVDAGQLDRALELLKQQGRITAVIEKTPGRPAERWKVVPRTAQTS